MKCPFRVNVEMDYETRTINGKSVVIQTGQREEYPECYGYGECPFMDCFGSCKRMDMEEE